MIWNGQVIGLLQNTPSVITWQKNEWVDFYQQLFAFYKSNWALAGGDFTCLSTDQDEKVYVFTRKNKENKVLVMVNCSAENRKVTFLKEGVSGMGNDFFSGKTHKFSKNNLIALEPWACQVYIYQ